MEFSSENNHNQEETIDIKKFVFKILSNWYWFVITVFIALGITYNINKYSDPVYRVTASILIKDRNSSMSGGVESIIQELGLYRRGRMKKVENEMAILKSYTLANKAINALDFEISYFSVGRIMTLERYKIAPFKVELDTSKYNVKGYPIYVKILSNKEYKLEIDGNYKVNTIMKFGELFENESFAFRITLTDFYKPDDINMNYLYYFVINDKNALSNLYRSKLSIETSEKKSSFLILSIQGLTPQKEVDYLNKLCDVYIQSDLDEKNQIAVNTIKFIDEQLANIADSLSNVENKLEAFRQYNKIIDISKEGMAIFERLEKLQSEKAKIKIKKDYYTYLKNYLTDNDDASDIITPSVMGINDPSLNNLVAQLNGLYSEKGVTEYSSTENNPALSLINLKIENIRLALIENVNNLIKTTDLTLDNINERIAKVDIEIQKLPITEKQLLNIQRKFVLNDNLYTYLLEKRAEAGISKASNIPENKIIDRAMVENAAQIAPKKSLNYIISVIIAVLIPLIIIILRDFFNDKIVERKDIESSTKVPIIGTIGHNDKKIEKVVYEKPKSSIAESFRTIRTNLQYMNADKKDNCMIITINSTVSGEGKTFCAINLATIFALSSKKTLLIGLDLRKPKLHKEFDNDNSVGLSTYLIGNNTKEEIIQHTEIENLDFMASGPIPPNPAELIETEKMKDLVENLKKEYDFIIMDTPPIALVTDALLLSKFAMTNVFVVRQNYSTKTVLRFINDLFHNKEMHSLSILINDVKVPSYYGYRTGYGYKYGGAGYNYGYGYGYGYGHGYYEDDEEKEKQNKLINRLLRIMKIKK